LNEIHTGLLTMAQKKAGKPEEILGDMQYESK